MQQRHAMLLGTALVFGLAAGSAFAGPCAQEIKAVQDQLSARDAGSGPVTVKPTQEQADRAQQTGSPSAVPADQNKSNLAANTTMNKASQDTATSSRDVSRQEESQPTASQSAVGAKSTGSDSMIKVENAVKQAKLLDNQNDPSCKHAVQEAQQLLSSSPTSTQ